jgi:hypothetical protein
MNRTAIDRTVDAMVAVKWEVAAPVADPVPDAS